MKQLVAGWLLGSIVAISGISAPAPLRAQGVGETSPEQICEFRYTEIMLNRLGGPASRQVSEAEIRWADAQKLRKERGEPCQLADPDRVRKELADAERLASFGDPTGARAILRRLCHEDGEDVACQNYGVMAMTGEGGSVDMAEGRAAFSTGCEKGFLLACQNYADALLNGEGGPLDDPRALSLYLKLCQKNYGGRNCYRAAQMVEDGRGVTHPDKAKALEGYKVACKQHYIKGCHRASDIEGEIQ